MSRGTLFVISAPSGAGKSTLVKGLVEKLDSIGFSVSHTTRAPRPGEVSGESYHFVSKEEFKKMADAGEFAEWANVHGNLYGTSFSSLEMVLDEGKDAILDIDVQGAMNLRFNSKLDPVLIFVMPPSVAELEKRLMKRGDVSEEVMDKRLRNAVGELAKAVEYDYVVINDDLNTAIDELRAVITAERKKTSRMAAAHPELFGRRS